MSVLFRSILIFFSEWEGRGGFITRMLVIECHPLFAFRGKNVETTSADEGQRQQNNPHRYWKQGAIESLTRKSMQSGDDQR